MLCQLHQRLHGCGAERHKRAGDQGLDNAKGAGCAEGLSIVEEVPVVESEAIVDVKSGLTTACSLPNERHSKASKKSKVRASAAESDCVNRKQAERAALNVYLN